MDKSIRKKLDDQDWGLMIKKLIYHAHLRLKFWNLISEKGIKGYSAKDIALEAISLVYAGDWRWNPEKSDLLTYLKYHVINGLVSNLARNKEVLNTDSGKEFDVKIDFSVEEDLNAKIVYGLIRKSLEGDVLLTSIFDGLYSGMKRKDLCQALNLTRGDYDNAIRRLKSKILKFRELIVLK